MSSLYAYVLAGVIVALVLFNPGWFMGSGSAGQRLGNFAISLIIAVLLVLALLVAWMLSAHAADRCDQYRRTLTREAQAVMGMDAPVPALAGQIRQESSCQADITAWDNGRGLAQFMDGTAAQVSRMYPELGAPNPYNPTWAIRALVRYDDWLFQRVKGEDDCARWGAAFKGYNAGLGFVLRAQKQSSVPGVWFNGTENINAGQSQKNFEYSRRYPRLIIFRHQPLFADWGVVTCEGRTP